MVIHEDSDAPAESPGGGLRPERGQYVVVGNHVRERRARGASGASGVTHDPPPSDNKTIHGNTTSNESPAEECSKLANSSAGDDAGVLRDLRAAYFECKQMLAKIENNYGDRLDLFTERGDVQSAQYEPTPRRKWKTEDVKSDCGCVRNKKIKFDDSGDRVASSAVRDHHICAGSSAHSSTHDSLLVEYESSERRLPDSMKELSDLLRDPNLPFGHRHAAVDKMRALRAELSNDLKYHRSSLVERLKRDTDESLEFVGTNLSALPGYSPS